MSEFQPIKNEFVPWTPWNTPVREAKVALITTAGLYLKHGLQEQFDLTIPGGDPTFREFPSVVSLEDLALSHVSSDQGASSKDLNVLFPLERLKELAAAGYIGSVAPFAYSFMGHVTDPAALLSNYAVSVAYRLKRMGPDLALFVATGQVDQQTAALVARAVELAGVPTLVLGTDRNVLESVGVPRGVVVKNPDFAPLGQPGNAGKHQHILRSAFDAAWEFESARMVAEL
ncbi:MAG: hypothetical protein ACM3XM_04275 [Mycobacterium leprae]